MTFAAREEVIGLEEPGIVWKDVTFCEDKITLKYLHWQGKHLFLNLSVGEFGMRLSLGGSSGILRFSESLDKAILLRQKIRSQGSGS
jgi:hypothetical protein